MRTFADVDLAVVAGLMPDSSGNHTNNPLHPIVAEMAALHVSHRASACHSITPQEAALTIFILVSEEEKQYHIFIPRKDNFQVYFSLQTLVSQEGGETRQVLQVVGKASEQ